MFEGSSRSPLGLDPRPVGGAGNHRRRVRSASTSPAPDLTVPPARPQLYAPGVRVSDLPTPSLVVEADVFATNVATMAAALPGDRLRPHVKAFKSTALA